MRSSAIPYVSLILLWVGLWWKIHALWLFLLLLNFWTDYFCWYCAVWFSSVLLLLDIMPKLLQLKKYLATPCNLFVESNICTSEWDLIFLYNNLLEWLLEVLKLYLLLQVQRVSDCIHHLSRAHFCILCSIRTFSIFNIFTRVLILKKFHPLKTAMPFNSSGMEKKKDCYWSAAARLLKMVLLS